MMPPPFPCVRVLNCRRGPSLNGIGQQPQRHKDTKETRVNKPLFARFLCVFVVAIKPSNLRMKSLTWDARAQLGQRAPTLFETHLEKIAPPLSSAVLPMLARSPTT